MIRVSIVCSECGCVGDSAKWGEKKPFQMRKELRKQGWKQTDDHDLCDQCIKGKELIKKAKKETPNWVHIRNNSYNHHDDFE